MQKLGNADAILRWWGTVEGKRRWRCMNPSWDRDPDRLLKTILDAAREVLYHWHAQDTDALLAAISWLDLTLQEFDAEGDHALERWWEDDQAEET